MPVSAPWGRQEAFIVRELAALLEAGTALRILPLRPGGELYHGRAAGLATCAEAKGLFHPATWLALATWLMRRPGKLAEILRTILTESRSSRIVLKNLAVLPKACWIASRTRAFGGTHVHAQWAGTTTTAAWIAATLLDLPFSFSAHRWDIGEDNMLALKTRRAAFARTSDGAGARELAEKAGPDAPAPWLLHLGVDLPACLPDRPTPPAGRLRVLVPANMVPKKGHAVLLEALAHPALADVDWHVTCAGDGPLLPEVTRAVEARGLSGRVKLVGMWPLERLHAALAGSDFDAVVLPSIETPDGETEGTPVSLVEALAHGLPVIASAIGGIPELLEGGCGVLVPHSQPEALALAMAGLARDPAGARELALRGHQRVQADYEVGSVARALLARVAGADGCDTLAVATTEG